MTENQVGLIVLLTAVLAAGLSMPFLHRFITGRWPWPFRRLNKRNPL